MSGNIRRRDALAAGVAGALVAPNASAAGIESPDDLAAACAAYMDAWTRKDINAIGERLHPDISFLGPMQQFQGKEAYLHSTARILTVLDRFVPRAHFISGDRAMFAYDFVCAAPIGVCRTAELVQFDNLLIRSTEVFYDARPFASARPQNG